MRYIAPCPGWTATFTSAVQLRPVSAGFLFGGEEPQWQVSHSVPDMACLTMRSPLAVPTPEEEDDFNAS